MALMDSKTNFVSSIVFTINRYQFQFTQFKRTQPPNQQMRFPTEKQQEEEEMKNIKAIQMNIILTVIQIHVIVNIMTENGIRFNDFRPVGIFNAALSEKKILI